jgi:hypothetical protein
MSTGSAVSVHAIPVCAGNQIVDVIGGMNGQRMLGITCCSDPAPEQRSSDFQAR